MGLCNYYEGHAFLNNNSSKYSDTVYFCSSIFQNISSVLHFLTFRPMKKFGMVNSKTDIRKQNLLDMPFSTDMFETFVDFKFNSGAK